MRRSDKEIIDSNEIAEILAVQLIGRLGTSLNDRPYITPVNFVYSDEKIYIHSASEGHKLTNIKANPNVCFEIEDVVRPEIKEPICASTAIYRSVIIFGKIRTVLYLPLKNYALTKLAEKYTGKPYTASFTDAMLNRVTVLEITIDELTAKRSPAELGSVRKGDNTT